MKHYQKFYETGRSCSNRCIGNGNKNRDSKLRDEREGYDYYMTARAGKETYPTYSHLGAEFFHMDWSRYSAARIGRFLSTPVMTIYGSKAGEQATFLVFPLES